MYLIFIYEGPPKEYTGDLGEGGSRRFSSNQAGGFNEKEKRCSVARTLVLGVS